METHRTTWRSTWRRSARRASRGGSCPPITLPLTTQNLVIDLSNSSILLLQLHSSAAGPVSPGRTNQPEAAEHPHAAEEMLQPPLPGGVPAGSCHSGVQGIISVVLDTLAVSGRLKDELTPMWDCSHLSKRRGFQELWSLTQPSVVPSADR